MSDLVQPLLVTLSDSHERIVTTTARASLLAFDLSENQAWSEWLSGLFTKTVRRIKDKNVQKVRELNLPFKEVAGGSMVAFAFEPMSYEEFPKLLKSAQVQGTQAPREAENADAELVEFMLGHHRPLYLINASLNMSTGKTSAQLAHAYWMAWLAQSEKSVTEFPHPATLWVTEDTFLKYKAQASHVVTDSGLTELSGPTDTVLVLK